MSVLSGWYAWTLLACICSDDLQDADGGDTELTRSVASSYTERIVEHSTYAHAQIRTIEQKLANKTQALSALKYTHKNDSKV